MKQEKTNASEASEATPFDETFDVIDINGFDETYEETKPKPLVDGRYHFEINGGEGKKCYTISKVAAPGSKIDGFISVRFGCRVVEDSIEDNNGKYVSTDFIVQGFMFQNFLDFCGTVTPVVKWKKSARLVCADGTSEVFCLLEGTHFQADIEEQLDSEGNGTGYNQIVGSRTKDLVNHIFNMNNESLADIHTKLSGK